MRFFLGHPWFFPVDAYILLKQYLWSIKITLPQHGVFEPCQKSSLKLIEEVTFLSAHL
jgi:hypothetical protein